MPENYILLERTELNASAASVTFSNIPQTGYTDLKIVMSARTDNTSPNILFSINGSTSTFSSRALYGDGASAASTSAVPRIVSYASVSTNTANTFGNTEIYIPNYTGSTNKSYSVDTVSENNATTAYTGLFAGLWSTTSAITSLTFTPDTGNFVANSTFSLYGIAALGTTPVIAPKAIGGNIIDFDGTNWIHTFTTSGTFTPLQGLTCDVLVVAGGGGGGGNVNAGGGGAGGFRTSTGFAVTGGTSLAVAVGAGGAKGLNAGATSGAVGGNSIFSSITSTGGGGGGGSSLPGGNGGSGGGGGYAGAQAGGSASPSGQGNNGGAGEGTLGNFAAGGGGGASAAGTVGRNSSGSGAGGSGTANSYSGSSVTYAGGGAGGAASISSSGGSGGGGNPGLPGSNNTGGGGGGATQHPSRYDDGANGGSGVVIIRYPA
jgi:hypothetical protein